MRLHGHPRSSATWRVRIALALKNVPVELVEHPPPDGGVTPASVLQIHPLGLVPVLETDGGQAIAQSVAILEWVEEMWPSPPLLPPGPILRARVRAFAHAIAADLHPLLTDRTLARLRHLGMTEASLWNWTRSALTEGLDACETLLGGAEGPFCFGADPSIADACLVPQLALARMNGVALTFPRLLAAEAACMTLPAFRTTCPYELWSDLP